MKVPKGRSVPVKFRSLWAVELDYRTKQAQSEHREMCIRCGFKIRGPNHESGTHHKKKHPKLRKDGK
jgi:hypothetical protein